MADYQIRYLKRDGRTSLLYNPNCIGDRDARNQAIAQSTGFASAEIWKDLERVEVIALEHAA